MMIQECTRHGLQPTRERHESRDWYVERCVHIGNRFVVDIRCDEWEAIQCDYVEELTDHGLIIESGGVGDWESMTARLLAGQGPQGDGS